MYGMEWLVNWIMDKDFYTYKKICIDIRSIEEAYYKKGRILYAINCTPEGRLKKICLMKEARAEGFSNLNTEWDHGGPRGKVIMRLPTCNPKVI